MTYLFHKCRLKGMGEDFPSEWFLVVKTLEELENYLRQVRPNQIKNDVLTRHRLDQTSPNSSHVANAHDHIARIRAERHGISWIEALAGLYDDINAGMIKSLVAGMDLYIRSCGSYCCDRNEKQYEILKKQTSEELIWPTPVVKIMQWPAGKHWYATVDGIDVEYNGVYKWSTKKEAEEAVRRYLDDPN